MKLICYRKCSTCKKAEKYLQDKGLDFTWRDIDQDIPTVEELRVWIELSGLDIKRFFNTSGLVYRENKLKDKLGDMTYDEKLEILSQNGMLIKRPILLAKDHVLVGFKEKEWDELFKK